MKLSDLRAREAQLETDARTAGSLRRMVRRLNRCAQKDQRWRGVVFFAIEDVGEILIRMIFLAMAVIRIPMHFAISVWQEVVVGKSEKTPRGQSSPNI